MEPTHRKRNENPPVTFSTEKRSEIINAYRSSGLSQSEFSRRHGINNSTLCGWLRRERTDTKTSPIQFIEATLPPSSMVSVEITSPRGFRIRFHINHDEQIKLLREVLQ